MKSIILILMLSAFSSQCFGQAKTIEMPGCAKVDSASFRRMQENDLECNSLPNLIKSKDSLHFRFSNGIQSVDIWTNDYKTFYGTLLNHTNTCVKYKKDGTYRKGKGYRKKQNIDTAKAKDIYNLFVALKIFSIPDQCSIKGWVNYITFQPYIIEYTTITKYSIKSYSSVYYYKHKLKEAASIDSLAKELGEKLKMQKSFDKFISGLPYGCYEAGGCIDVCNFRRTRFNWLMKHYLTSAPPFLYSHKRLIRKMPGYYRSRFAVFGTSLTQLQLNKDSTFKYACIIDLDIEKYTKKNIFKINPDKYSGYYMTYGKYKFIKDTLYFSYAIDTVNIYEPLDTSKRLKMWDTDGNWIWYKPKLQIRVEVSSRPKRMLYRYGRLWELGPNGHVYLRQPREGKKSRRYYLKRINRHKWQDWQSN